MFRLFLVLIFAIFNISIFSHETIILNSKTQTVLMGKSVYIYEDRFNALDFQTISHPDFQKNFILSQSDTINYSYSPHAYWFRFDIENEDFQTLNWLLEIGYSHLDSIEFYFEKDNE